MASTPESSGSRGIQRLCHPPPAPPRAAAVPTQRPRAHRAEQRRRRGADAGRRHRRYRGADAGRRHRRSPSSPPPLQRPPPPAAAAEVRLVPTPAASACPASVSRRRRGACPSLCRRQGRVAEVQGRVAPAPPSARWRTTSPAGAPTRVGEQGRMSPLPLVQGSAPSVARLHGHRARRPPPRRKQGRGGWSRVARARPRARIRRARGSRAPNRAPEHRIEPLLFPRGEREQRNEAPGRRAAAGVRREEGAACFHAPLDP
jgi:hypothetical protein